MLQSNGQIPEEEIPFPASLRNGENESKLNILLNIADKCQFVPEISPVLGIFIGLCMSLKHCPVPSNIEDKLTEFVLFISSSDLEQPNKNIETFKNLVARYILWN